MSPRSITARSAGHTTLAGARIASLSPPSGERATERGSPCRPSCGLLSNYARLSAVFLYAIAMAWVESAVVFYLRTMVHRIDPHQPDPLPLIGGLGPVELVREAATLVMLLAVGVLAGRTWRARLGYAAVAFGVWDIFYYVFLKAICGWPHSLLDWDILFLLPLPWWGPVLAPVCIALLMIVWGALASREDGGEPVGNGARWQDAGGRRAPGAGLRRWAPWVLNLVGVSLALYVFMADTIGVSRGGVEVVRKVLPQHFQWPLFGLALVLMGAPIIALCGRDRRSRAERRRDRGEKTSWGRDCGGALG